MYTRSFNTIDEFNEFINRYQKTIKITCIQTLTEKIHIRYEGTARILFTTEDGYEIREGMKCWYYCPDSPAGKDLLEYRMCNGKATKGKYFYSKEATKEYVKSTKPKIEYIESNKPKVIQDTVEYKFGENHVIMNFNSKQNTLVITAHGNNNVINIIPIAINSIELIFK